MSLETINLIIDKAKTKKDGVYSFRGYVYVVKDNNFRAFVDRWGEIFYRAGAFNVRAGKVKDPYNKKKEMKELLKIL